MASALIRSRISSSVMRFPSKSKYPKPRPNRRRVNPGPEQSALRSRGTPWVFPAGSEKCQLAAQNRRTSGSVPPVRTVTPSRRRAAHLHLVAHLADLEGGLRSGRRSPHDRAVVEAEHAAVPGTHDAAVADLTLVQWTALVGAGGRD